MPTFIDLKGDLIMTPPLNLNDALKQAIQTEKDLDTTAEFLATFAIGGLKTIKEKYNA